jgi:hyperosmotically inducible periplasmic protein
MTKSAISSFLSTPLLVFGIEVAIAQTGPSDPSAANSMDRAVPTDNTESNRQDPTNRDQTADKQLNNSTDLDFTRRIRRDVTADKNLSIYGHNVKIVSANGTVTLNGVVRTDAEKAEIGMKAASVVGKDHVVNEIKVAPAK